MGKVLKGIAIVAAIAVVVFAPQISAAILGALAIKSAIAVALVTAALVTGAGVLASLARRTAKPTSTEGTPQIFRQSITASFIIYGKRRQGGLLVFFHPRKVGSVHYRYFVVACAGHHCQGVTKWFLNDEEVTVSSNMVTSGPYANKAWLWFQNGDASETANATFVSECGGKWTTDHKGNGIAAIYAKFEMSDEVVQAGMPNITAEIEGKDDIYDYRDESTGYTRNAVLCFYDWMSLPREEGGFGAYDDEIPDATLISAWANVCEETVDSEDRYAIDALISTGASPAEIRDVFVVNCAGSYTYSGGKHIMRPGYWVPVSETLLEADAEGPIQVSRFLGGDQTANEVQGTYVEPTDGYQAAAFATQSTGDPDIRQLDLDLAFITSRKRAGRIASIMLKRAQAEKTVTWPANITGLKVQALDTVQLDATRYGLSNYAWTVTNWDLSPEFGVVLRLREESEDIYTAPSYSAPPAPATVDAAETVMTTNEASTLINTSSAVEITIEAAEDEIVISNHFRRYTDLGDIAVTGATITLDENSDPIAPDTEYLISYDDATRAGGAVTYTAHPPADTFDAFTSAANPFRHYVGFALTPSVGEDPITGGGSLPPGAGGWGVGGAPALLDGGDVNGDV